MIPFKKKLNLKGKIELKRMSTQLSESCKVYIKSINKIKTSKNAKPKKLSGYNVFCQEQRTNIKGTPTEIMSKLGGLWKKTDDKKKEMYKKKAEKSNTIAAKKAEKEKVEEDVQTMELKAAIEELINNFKKDLKKKKVEETEVEEAEEEPEEEDEESDEEEPEEDDEDEEDEEDEEEEDEEDEEDEEEDEEDEED